MGGATGETESVLLRIKYDEIAEIPPEIAGHLLPFLRSYQEGLLWKHGISDAPEQIDPPLQNKLIRC
jgi:hypothetical protein